jgi:hypothetical protein
VVLFVTVRRYARALPALLAVADGGWADCGFIHNEGALMMKKLILGLGLFALAGTLLAAPLPCAELQAQIDAKLQAKGVKSYSLDVVAKGSAADKQVVGSCEAGSKEIVYTRK